MFYTRFRGALSGSVLFVVFFFVFEAHCIGSALDSHSVPKTVAASSVVAVARLTGVSSEQVNPPVLRSGGGSGGRSGRGSRPAVKYTFTISSLLKGQCPETIEVRTPSRPVAAPGQGSPILPSIGRSYIIFVNQGSQNSWAPTDPDLAMAPIATDSKIPTTKPADPAEEVISLLLNSLSDPAARSGAVFALQSTQNKAVEAALRPLMDDPDESVRQNALYAMAVNQVVEAIPRIVAQAKAREAAGRGSMPVGLLSAYEGPEAVPYLNPLINDPSSQAVRIVAMATLLDNGLANKSSIPFLIEALRDAEPQGLVAHPADEELHRLIPALGPAKQHDEFMAESREAEINAAEKWWADEQAGKHGSGPSIVRPRAAPATPLPPTTRAARGPAD